MFFRYRLMRWMSGRYGPDTLGYLCIGIGAAIAFLNCFLRIIWLQIPVGLLLVFALLRMFSRNITARQKENAAFRRFFTRVWRDRQVRAARRADRTHIYKKCPYCHVILRLPRRKGKHKTVCPHCEHAFRVFVFREI